MEKTVKITYNIVNPGKKGSAVEKAVVDEIKCIRDAVKTPITGVVINCRQSGKKPAIMPMFDDVVSLQNELQIGEVTVNKSFSNKESHAPQEILERMRELHDELGDQISEIDDDPQTATSALESIYAQMEMQLDALEDALGDDDKGQRPLLSNDQPRLR